MGGLGKTTFAKKVFDNLRIYINEKRYAVVFDDVWSINFWECVKLALPDNNDGRKIIITKLARVRLLPLAEKLFLIKCSSFNHYPKISFGNSQEDIQNSVGSSTRARAICYYNSKDVSQWRKLLDSYYDLPYQLRPFFIYFGSYPENRTITCGGLIRQWINEGFIKEQRRKTLEVVALRKNT
ncbi:hypothetical protein PRUPE_8G122900 [Prunus persica]|uniref:Uncharacterized protein n=1 Tax=Prunus persica TaxID=3760 RepID=M5VYQ2_PRUPE|nr:hypothetical protein PRUPE_8G122900 [Prunus persica]